MAYYSPALRFFNLGMGPHDVLLAYIPTQDLLHLMYTSKFMYNLVRDTCFGVSRLLVPFFGTEEAVECFQNMQAETGTLISGSTSLQFLNRLIWPESDLDLYAHRAFADAPVNFIVGNGYTFDPRPAQNADVKVQLISARKDRGPSYLGRGIADVLDFHKGNRKVQLIVAATTLMEGILSFHSTCVMNILAHDYAYALYPHSTFISKHALVIQTVGAGQEAGRDKYEDRGWLMVQTPALADLVSETSELSIKAGTRWVGDAFTWTIPLARSARSTARNADLSPINSWVLEYDEYGQAKTKWGFLDSPRLRFKYTVGDPHLVLQLWKQILPRLDPSGLWLGDDLQLHHLLVTHRQVEKLPLVQGYNYLQ